MLPIIAIGPLSLPAYWLCAMAGLAAAALLAVRRKRCFPHLLWVDITNAAALGGVGGLLGGWLLYLAASAPLLWQNRAGLSAHPEVLPDVLTGLAFYGGLFGFLAAVRLYLWLYKLPAADYFNYFTPCIPLFHAFARVGCFLAGCCHGIVCPAFGFAFTGSTSAPNGVPYFPVQLLGSVIETGIFIVLLRIEDRGRRCGTPPHLLRDYLMFYAIARFFIEFLRGDTVRGMWGPFSTSQWISLAVLAWFFLSELRRRFPSRMKNS